MTNKKKQEMYDAQYSKISKLFEEVEENKKSIVTGLIEQACFMYVQLKELNEIINKKGVVEKFKQGKQQFDRERPATKTYNTMIKNYNLITRQLIENLPNKKPLDPDDEFEEFNKI